MSTSLDVRYQKRRIQIFTITWFAYAGFYLTRKSFAVAKIDMGEGTEIGFTGAEMSLIDGSFLAAYAIGQFICGMCGDRYGARKVVLCGMILSVITGFWLGMSTTVLAFCILFLIQGLAQATGWGPLAKNVAQFFSQKERGSVMGLWCTNYAVGGLAASAIAGYCGERWGYTYAFYGPSLLLLIITVFFYLFQRDKPEDFGLPSIESYHKEDEHLIDPDATLEVEKEGSWTVIKDVCMNPIILRLSAVYFFLKPTRYAILLWGPTYVAEKLTTGMKVSGFLNGLIDLAGPISIFLAGVISDRVFGSKRMPVAVSCLFALALLLGCMHFVPPTRIAVGCALFVMGLLIFAPDSLISGTAAVDFGTKRGASTASGLVNGFGSLGAIIGGTLPGIIKETYGWTPVFLSLAATLVIAGLLLAPKWHALPPEVKKRS
jgi:OPA family sugar phosphate sensor protein UhpC-like MFS transporter